MIIFKTREATDGIRLHFQPTKESLTVQELEKQAKRDGKFSLGFHFILRKNGEVEKGIDIDMLADPVLAGAATAVYVLVETAQLNDAQQNALKKLTHTLNLSIVGD